MSDSVSLCPDCGATIQDSFGGTPVRCWLCAYAMSASDLTEIRRRPPSDYESVYDGLYLLTIGFFALIGIGHLFEVVFLGESPSSLIAYAIFVGTVIAISLALRRQKTRDGQPIRGRERFLTLLGSLFTTLMIGIAIVIAICVALFAACLSVIVTN